VSAAKVGLGAEKFNRHAERFRAYLRPESLTMSSATKKGSNTSGGFPTALI